MKPKTEIRDQHVTLGGHVLTMKGMLEEQAAFLARVREASKDPRLTPDDVTALVWSEENPLLARGLIPGRAMATRETYEHPAFRAMLDYIDRKRATTGDLDLERAEARYTMTVPEAAEALGVAESTLRRAVQEGRLAGWKKGGVFYLDPTAVESYRVSIRGLKAEVQVAVEPARALWIESQQQVRGAIRARQGTQGDYFLRIKALNAHPFRNANRKGPISDWLVLPGWKRIAVLRGKKRENDYRLFVLESAPREDGTEIVLKFADFVVQGEFRIAKKINNPRRALEAWDAFEAA